MLPVILGTHFLRVPAVGLVAQQADLLRVTQTMGLALHVQVQREGGRGEGVCWCWQLGVVVRRLENDVSILLTSSPKGKKKEKKAWNLQQAC